MKKLVFYSIFIGMQKKKINKVTKQDIYFLIIQIGISFKIMLIMPINFSVRSSFESNLREELNINDLIYMKLQRF